MLPALLLRLCLGLAVVVSVFPAVSSAAPPADQVANQTLSASATPAPTATATPAPTTGPSRKSRAGSADASPANSVFNSRLGIQVGPDGKFNAGAFPDPSTGGSGAASWDIIYRWPAEPWSSFSTLRVDGSDFIYGITGSQVEAPTNINATTNRSKWQIGEIEVTQTLELVFNPQTGQRDLAKIAYTVRNTGSSAHTVGLRVMVDDEIDYNDGAKFRVPGTGIITTEREFTGASVPDTFSVFKEITDSEHVAAGTLRSSGATTPDRFVIADWNTIYNLSVPFDYTVDSSRDITSDSAYAVYWNPASLAPGASQSYVTFYGLTQLDVDLTPPLALGLSGPSALSIVDGAYTPNPFSIVATVLNTSAAPVDNVQVRLNLPTGLSLTSGSLTQLIGTLAANQETQVSWSVQAAPDSLQNAVTYSVTVTGTGAPDKTVSRRLSAAQGATTWYFAEGYTGTGFDEYLTIQNPGSAGTATITYYVEGTSTPVTRTVSLAANSRTTVAVHSAASSGNPGGLGRLSVGHSTKVDTTVPTVVERPMYFQYGGTINGGHNVMGATTPSTAWYFAEGYTGTGFDEYLTIQNPGTAGTATITYYVEGTSTPVTRTVSLAANSRTTVAVHSAASSTNPGGLGRLSAGHSTKVESTVAVVVERPMYFQYGSTINGGHNVMGAGGATTVWYFAEGYTGPGFDEFLTIQNPGSAGTATITYYVEGTSTPQTRTVSLAANSRTTVAVHSGASSTNPGGLGRLSVGHSTKVDSDIPVVVERPMYFQYGGIINGGHNVMGASGAGTAWYFAEGYTGTGFDEYLTIQNPGSAGTATITYYVEGTSTPRTRTVSLAANSRTTVAVHSDASSTNPGGLGRLSVGHSTKVESTVAVVVERPMYFQYGSTINGGHNVMGFAP